MTRYRWILPTLLLLTAPAAVSRAQDAEPPLPLVPEAEPQIVPEFAPPPTTLFRAPLPTEFPVLQPGIVGDAHGFGHPLYPNVRYQDLQNVAPHAVTKIVAVKNPGPACGPCGTVGPPCVFVKICVPPCKPHELDIKRKDRSKVEYDFGDYEVEITSKNGLVTVDYDD